MGNGPENCDPGNSNLGDSSRSNDEVGGTPGDPGRKVVELPLSKRIVSSIGRVEFHTVRLENSVAVPAYKESGAITSMAHADGYIEIPANVDLVEKGERVRVVLF